MIADWELWIADWLFWNLEFSCFKDPSIGIDDMINVDAAAVIIQIDSNTRWNIAVNTQG